MGLKLTQILDVVSKDITIAVLLFSEIFDYKSYKIKDEKNQIMTTNVWLRQVNYF